MRGLLPIGLALSIGCSFDADGFGSGGPDLVGASSSSGTTSSSSSGSPEPGTTSDEGTATFGSPPATTTGESESSSTGDGTTGGDGMIDQGLLARWWIDEATEGQGPPTLLDDAKSPLPLSLIYDAGWPVFTVQDGSRGIYWDQVGRNGRAQSTIMGNKLGTLLDDSTTATFELVLSVDGLIGQTSRFLHVGNGSGTDLAIGSNDFGLLEVRWRNVATMYFSTMWTGDRQILHVVVDTSQPAPVDRVRAYVDGVELQPTAESGPTQVGLPFADNASFVLGNRGDGQRSIAGSLHYAAVYLDPFKPTQVAINAAALKASDDGP